jgi:hypothetical protein
LRKCEELARLQADGYDEVACAFRRRLRQQRGPDVEEALRLHEAAHAGDDRTGQAEVGLHAVAAEVEVAVAKPRELVHALLADLERQRLAAGGDLEGVDLELDLAGRELRIDRIGRAADELALGAEHELVAYLVSDRGRLRGVLGVDDELDDAGVVAQVDEDEAAMVAPARRPAGQSQPFAHTFGARLAAHEVAPGHRRSPSSSSETTSSSAPVRRRSASPSRTITVVAAPSRPACVSWPFNERPA